MSAKEHIWYDNSYRSLCELALLTADHVSAMLAYWDSNLICRFANNAYVEWFGRTKEDMVNKMGIDELLGPLYERNLPYITAVLSGKKQIFEREIPIPGGSEMRQALATYTPDIRNEKVIGFFVLVADVTYLKDLEQKVALGKRETLRKIIETEELEKKHVVDILRESVNQKLAACRMIIERERKTVNSNSVIGIVSENISEIIQELSVLCRDLLPSEIDIFGLVETIEQYIHNAARLYKKDITVIFNQTEIEQIQLKDKYSTYRILQNFIVIAVADADVNRIEVFITYTKPDMSIRIFTDSKIELERSSKEYHAIASRIDYHNGKISEYVQSGKNVFEMNFTIADI